VTLIHATAIAIGTKAVLIQGPSGAGKSDLALRCLAVTPSPLIPIPAHLIADDQVQLKLKVDGIWLEAPDPIFGQMEVRGLGIIKLTPCLTARLSLIVNLLPANHAPERLPERQTTPILGHDIPTLALQSFEPSAPLKLLLALQLA
jgi:HPr kinase/phosphorylase